MFLQRYQFNPGCTRQFPETVCFRLCRRYQRRSHRANRRRLVQEAHLHSIPPDSLPLRRHDRTCRQLFRQFHSRMIRDKYIYEDLDLSFLNVSKIYARELGEYFISGCTGLYFMVELTEPTDLCYKEDEWDG